MTYAHVAIATLNQTVGDWRGNRSRIIQAAEIAVKRGATLLLCPELSLSGYSLLDRVYRQSTLDQSFQSLVELAEASRDLPLVLAVGLPISYQGLIYNAAALVAGGVIQGFSCKSHLAHGDVEYKERYFAAWPQGQSSTWLAPNGVSYPIGALIFERSQTFMRFRLNLVSVMTLKTMNLVRRVLRTSSRTSLG